MVVDIASGSSTDYAYMGEGVVYAYALELRDTGVYGNLANVTFQLWPYLLTNLLCMCINSFWAASGSDSAYGHRDFQRTQSHG